MSTKIHAALADVQQVRVVAGPVELAIGGAPRGRAHVEPQPWVHHQLKGRLSER
jgi:hypothetical protein